MRRREFARTTAVLGVTVVSGGAIATGVFANREATVRQVVRDGTPRAASMLSIPLRTTVELVDEHGVTVSVPIVDPTEWETERRAVPVRSVTAAGRRLRLVLEGPASRGTVVSVADESVRLDGEPTAGFALRLDGNLDRPGRATQWFKAYEPTDVDLFDSGVYADASAPVRGTEPGGVAEVRERLSDHLDRFVDRGRLPVEERDAALERFDDPTVRERFVDSDGGFAPRFLAGVLANAGTVARGLERVVVDGENALGERYTVKRQSPPSGGLMEVRIYDGAPVIFAAPRLDGEPFQVLAPLFAHEGLHQDLAVGIREEIIATYLETLVWAEHLLADPTLARRGSAGVKRANRNLLVALNSGRLGFPEIGLRGAPRHGTVTSATPGADDPIPDVVSIVESYYRDTPPGASPGTAYARQLVGRVADRPVDPVAYDRATLELLDRETRLFSTDEVLSLLATLGLRPAGVSDDGGETGRTGAPDHGTAGAGPDGATGPAETGTRGDGHVDRTDVPRDRDHVEYCGTYLPGDHDA